METDLHRVIYSKQPLTEEHAQPCKNIPNEMAFKSSTLLAPFGVDKVTNLYFSASRLLITRCRSCRNDGTCRYIGLFKQKYLNNCISIKNYHILLDYQACQIAIDNTLPSQLNSLQ